MVRPVWTTEPAVPPHASEVGYWKTLLVEDDPDPEFRTHHHLFAERRLWHRGCIDGLLREVADDVVAHVFITDLQMERVYHPYDGGADVFLLTPAERDQFRAAHADWLSKHSAGL